MNMIQQIEMRVENEKKAHDNFRKKVWLNAYCAVAGCFNSEKSNAISWADHCLAEFDKRFPKPELETLNKIKELFATGKRNG